METTTKILNTYRDDEIKGLSFSRLSYLYKVTRQECIIAEAFERVKNLTILRNNLYPQICIEDKISYALEKLHVCLLTYNPDNNTKFTTYYIRTYSNRLREASQYISVDKRRIVFNTTSLNKLVETGFDVGADSHIHNVVTIPDTLTNNEKIYCELLAINYGTNKEIAEKMNVSVMTLCNIRKSLRIKLRQLYKNS